MMSHHVLYRRYRPKDFSEVVGQEYVVKALVNAIAQGRIAHAYLFSGPRGTGKTSVARLLAKAANCTEIKGKPCNTCQMCVDFNDGRFMDLIEIDAASNRGIDEIRSLRDAVRFVPSRGARKVYIIDECHMLTKEAFNALLKTLEEPPEHAIFVLATTELEKLPPTIVSRTQHYVFTRPSVPAISAKLLSIAKKENVSLDAAAADLIALSSEGGLRDAESILGQMISAADGRVTQEDVERMLGAPRRESVRELFSAITEKNIPKGLMRIQTLSESGCDMQFVAKMLIRYVRSALRIQSGADDIASVEKDLLPEEISFIKGVVPQWSDAHLADALAVLLEALARFKQSPIPELPLELAVVEIVNRRGGAQTA